jgi:hypothetical protein
MAPMSDRKPPVDAALDALVYAPLGFVLEARGLMPKLVERGRNQVTMAKMVGQFAVQQGQVEATKRLGPVQEQVREQVESVLADFGLVARPAPRSAPDAPATATSTPVEAASPAAAPAPAPAPAVPALDADELVIPDYDSLAASQVVPRLRALSASELEDVRAYEAAGRARKTILNRIAQLQAD